MSLPVFLTDRLILRDITLADAPAYQRHFNDYEVIRHLTPKVPWPYPETGATDFITGHIIPKQGNGRWIWGIARKEMPDEVIGVIELWRDGHPENRAFWLGRKYWGKGYITEAVEPVMDYAFNDLGFEKLMFANAVGNTRSARIKNKTGARLVRVEPAEFIDPAYTEHEVYELTKADWQAFKDKRNAR